MPRSRLTCLSAGTITGRRRRRLAPVLTAALLSLTLGRRRRRERPVSRAPLRRRDPPRRPRDVRPRAPVPRRLADRERRLGEPGGGERARDAPGSGSMAFLASGEDPNFGLYSNHVRRALRNMITAQDAEHRASWAAACTTTASRCSAWPKPTGRWTSGTSGPIRQGPAVDRPGPGTGRPRGGHLAEEEPARGLAVLAGGDRRRHLGQRRGAGRPARGPQRRHRGARRGDRPGRRLLQSMTSPSGFVAYAGGMGGFGDSTRPHRRSPPWSTPSPGARICPNSRRRSTTSRSGSSSRRRAIPNTRATTRPRPSSRGTSRPGRSGTRCWSAS